MAPCLRLVAALACGGALAFMLAPASARACDPRLELRFEDDAPRDRLTLTNASTTGGWRAIALEVDLADSAGALIFDTVPGGAGFNVAQPLIGPALAAPPNLADGDRTVTLTLRPIPPGRSEVLTLDLDNTIGRQATIVDGAEIDGAAARATFRNPAGVKVDAVGRFDPSGVARLAPAACV